MPAADPSDRNPQPSAPSARHAPTPAPDPRTPTQTDANERPKPARATRAGPKRECPGGRRGRGSGPAAAGARATRMGQEGKAAHPPLPTFDGVGARAGFLRPWRRRRGFPPGRGGLRAVPGPGSPLPSSLPLGCAPGSGPAPCASGSVALATGTEWTPTYGRR
jgi:hypothetical protein